MLLLITVALACLCDKLNLPSTLCVGDTLISSSIFDDCSFTQAAIDCGLISCTEAMVSYNYCDLVCECAPGCTMDVLSISGENNCDPACNNADCNYCLWSTRTASATSLYSECPGVSVEVSYCLRDVTLTSMFQSCESMQAYFDCYLVHPCLAEKLNESCENMHIAYPNCTFKCASGASFLHAAIALLFGL